MTPAISASATRQAAMSICLRNRDPPRRQSAQSGCSHELLRQFPAAMQNHSVMEVTI
jgi:hypothetical protein